MMMTNKDLRQCGFYKDVIIDRYNKVNSEKTTELFREIFSKKVKKTIINEE